MISPSAAALLNIWEQGRNQAPVQRGLLLLITIYPQDPPEVLANLSIGRRDRILLSLREQLFGPQLSSVADCPHCKERLELNFTVADIAVDDLAVNDIAVTDKSQDVEQMLAVAGYEIRFRLLNSMDLLVLSDKQMPARSHGEDLRSNLLERCIVGITHQSIPCSLADMPIEVLQAVEQRMAEMDTQANIQLDLTCPNCRHQWLAAFDTLAYLWSEIDAWAHRILQEVHLLASAYGWREADILDLSPWRRQFYLNMIQ